MLQANECFLCTGKLVKLKLKIKMKDLSFFLAVDLYLLSQCFSANSFPKKMFCTLFINYQ